MLNHNVRLALVYTLLYYVAASIAIQSALLSTGRPRNSMENLYPTQEDKYIDLPALQEAQAKLQESQALSEDQQRKEMLALANEAAAFIRYKLSTDPDLKKNYVANYHRTMNEWCARVAEENRTILEGKNADEIKACLKTHLEQLFELIAILVTFTPKEDPFSEAESPLPAAQVATALEVLWRAAVDYQKEMLGAMASEGKSEAELAKAALMERYGGEDPTKATHVSITITEPNGNGFWEHFKTKEWAGGVLRRLISAVALQCQPYVGEARLAKVTFMYYGINAYAEVSNEGRMDLHADSGVDRYKFRACYRAERNGQPTTMRFAFVGYEKREFCYDLEVNSGELIFGGNSLWRYKATRVKHGVPQVSTPRHTVILDWA